MPLPMSSDVAASTRPPARHAEQREHRDQRGTPLGQPLAVLRTAAQLDRPVRELRDRQERAGVQRRPLIDFTAAERPRVERCEDHQRPREQRRQRRREGHGEQDDRHEREHAHHRPVRVGRQRDRASDARREDERGDGCAYTREYLACRLNAPTSASAPSSGSPSCHSTTGTPKR